MKIKIMAMATWLLLITIGVAFGAADDISRLYNFTPGSTISSAAFNQEFNQVITTLNAKFGRGVDNTLTGNNIFSGANTFSGNNTFSGTNTFSHASTPLKTDLILERTAAAGVTIDGVVLKDNTVTPVVTSDPGTPVEGQLWYNSTANQVKYYDGSSTKIVANTAPTIVYPAGHIAGPPPVWVDATAIKIPTGLKVASKDADYDIVFASDATCDFDNGNGANGLDTGGETSNAWYYLYAIADNTGVNTTACLISAVNESVTGSITLPSGYNEKRQLPYSFRNNASSNIISQYVAGGWPFNPLILYQVDFDIIAGTGPTEVLSAGAATTATAVDLSGVVSPLSKTSLLKFQMNSNGTASIYVRATGATDFDRLQVTAFTGGTMYCRTNSSQSIDYKLNTASYPFDIAVYGYVIEGNF